MDISPEAKQTFESMIRKFDVNGDGFLDNKELEKCLQLAGFNPTHEDVTFIQQRFDENGDGRIQVSEVLDNLDVVFSHSVIGKDLMESFKKFDFGGDGFIGRHELLQILTIPGPNQMNRQDANELISELLDKYDINGDGKFSYSEFVRMMTGGALMG